MVERTVDLPEAWHDETDLVVCGSGAAGLTGAVVAAESARVVVLEKSEVVGGTTSISGGGFWIPLNRHLPEAGVTDSRDEALGYVRACASGQGDDEVLVALVDVGAEMVRYLEDRVGMSFRAWPAVGGTIDYRPWLPGAKPGGRTLDAGRFDVAGLGEWAARVRLGVQSEWTVDKLDFYRHRQHTLPPNAVAPRWRAPREGVVPTHFAAGTALIGQLLKGCLQRGVVLHTGAAAEALLVDDGRVVGVRALRDGQPYCVRAHRGVLIATGGYAHNEELKRLWMSRPLEISCEIVENQGDGHLMGMAVGAQMANLGDAWWAPQIHVGAADGGPINISSTREDRTLPHTMMVNARARRFVNEALNYYDVCEAFGLKSGGSERNLPAWLLFDRQGRDAYAPLAARVPAGEAPEWLTVTDSVPELAERLGLDPTALTQTVERFNRFAREGADPDFGRGRSPWDAAWGDPRHGPNPSLGTLEEPPFYAVDVRPGALATKGGLRVNANGEVLAAARPRAPIPGLYAAGNCSSGGVAGAYPGAGATIGAAMTFGYIAGRRIAREPAPSLSTSGAGPVNAGRRG